MYFIQIEVEIHVIFCKILLRDERTDELGAQDAVLWNTKQVTRRFYCVSFSLKKKSLLCFNMFQKTFSLNSSVGSSFICFIFFFFISVFSHYVLDIAAPPLLHHLLSLTHSLSLSLPIPRCHCASHPAQGLGRYFKQIWEINLTAN